MRSRLFALLFLFVVVLVGAHAGPIFGQQGLLGFLQPSAATQRPQTANGQRKGRSRYDHLCRGHNVDPYAFPGRAPYPSAPLCSYAG
ncbi:Hypothetical predicted protein [Cloeon dipterum]|uniref:Uncharacterized protein n=1 Tax=Cloeon dipterum TaxID=197152 RepID=A0A8S1CR81_9INSE|nr:Hypothetical predicted protein [Cloeon dipterum]